MGLFDFIGKNKSRREESVSADEWRRETKESARETAAKGYEKAIAEGMEEGQALYAAARQIDPGDKKPRDENELVRWQLQMEEACSWYEKAAEKNVEEAILRYARMNEKGLGTERDMAKAFLLYQKLAQQGSREGQNGLGNCYYFGKGVACDYKESLKWYEMAAQQGHVSAQEMCGYMYLMGHGTDVDYDKAYSWYSKSERNGHTVTNSWYKSEKERRSSKQEDSAVKYVASESMKREARTRLDTLVKNVGLSPGIPVLFSDGEVYCSTTKLNGDPDTQPVKYFPYYFSAVQSHEEDTGCLVYHVIAIGQKAYFLTVNRDETCWAEERPNGDIIKVCIFDTTEMDCHHEYVRLYTRGGKLFADSISASEAECNSPKFIEGKDADWWFAEGVKYYHGKGVDVNNTKALACMENAALLGDDTAMYNCGLMYSQGKGTVTDLGKAFDWYKRAAEMGNAEAQFKLGNLYSYGKGCEENAELAYMWLEKAAENGHADACMIVAGFLEKNEESDKTKILHLYETAAQQGNSYAMVKCMDMYGMGEGCEEDMEKAAYWANRALEESNAEMLFRIGNSKLNESKEKCDLKEVFDQYLIPSAEQGHSGALYLCGYAYLVGTFFEQDKKRGIDLIEMSAEEGNEAAVKMLYELYTKGELIAADSEKAFYWLEQLAEIGNTEAIQQVAEAYENKENSFADSKKAMFWYEKLAQTGDVDAMYKVFDVVYINADSGGKYSEDDASKAFYWVMKAADCGHPEAMRIATQICSDGKDYDRALQYGLKAAENGDIFAMTACADIYLNGRGSTEENWKKALYWSEKAAQSGVISYMIVCAMLYVCETGEIPVDKEKAHYWLDLAESALENSTEQDLYCKQVADLYYKCARDNKDLSKAFYWYEKSALNGTIESIYNCAMMCLHGEGCEKNYDKAMEFAELAAEQGDDGDMLAQIADLFRDGKEGLSVNETEALRWYKRAGECGSVYAMKECGWMYFSGGDTSENNAEAFYWYKKAAEAGSYSAMVSAGVFYLDGEDGVPRDLHKARELFEKASKSDSKGTSELANFYLLLTEEKMKNQK